MAASGYLPSLSFFNLGPDELSSVKTLRLKAILATTEQPKVTLAVTTIDRKGPFVIDLGPVLELHRVPSGA